MTTPKSYIKLHEFHGVMVNTSASHLGRSACRAICWGI